MIEFIPLEDYFSFFLNLSLVVVLMTLVHAYVLKIDDGKNLLFINGIGYFLLFFLILYIGLRPVSGRFFGDMRTYARHFNYYSGGGEVVIEKDVFFHYYMKVTSYFMSVHGFFTLCAFLYIFPLYRVAKAFFKEYWFYAFLMFIVSFSFWSYGTNGIRNGIATSLFILALSYENKKVIMYGVLLIACMVHNSLYLPLLAFVMTLFYNNPKGYLIGWLCAIPLSIALGGFWENFFAGLGFADDRLGGYLGGEVDQEAFSSTGFRYDFLLYSASAVFAGWYFIFKKGFSDKFYHRVFNTYLTCNAFWVLVIRANFSNRFAYLSWFLLGFIIVYPYLKRRFFKNHYIALGKIIFIYFAFTYFMFVVYYGVTKASQV